MRRIPEAAPIGSKRYKNSLLAELAVLIYLSAFFASMFLVFKFKLLDLLMHIPIISHVLTAFMYILFGVFLLSLLLMGAVAVGFTIMVLYFLAFSFFSSIANEASSKD